MCGNDGFEPCKPEDDLKPCKQPQGNLYCCVSKDKAIRGGDVVTRYEKVTIEGFRPNERNKNTTVCCGSPIDKHYSFENGYGKGFNCEKPWVDIVGEKQELIGTNGYAVKAAVTIKLLYNEIFYPRPIEFSKLNEELSKKIYLHELGHKLDTHNTVVRYLWELAAKHHLDVKNIVPEEGLTFTEEIETETESNADTWLKNLRDMYGLEIKYNLENAVLSYHGNYGKFGDPWDGKDPISPYPEHVKEKTSKENELKNIKEKLDEINKRDVQWRNVK